MKKILIFAGTTEGRRLSEILGASGILHTVSVATEYGEMVMKDHPAAEILCGRMDEKEMEALFRSRNFEIIVDATHPYARLVTENIKKAAAAAGIVCLRLRRGRESAVAGGEIRYFSSHEACRNALKETEGNLLLTTGSKELAVYCADEKLRERIYARVLPGMESLRLCMENGLCGKQILAMQGPFSAKLNEALISQYQISCLVTKMSGKNGGFSEKLQAARTCGIPVFAVGEEGDDSGEELFEICRRLEEYLHIPLKKDPFFEITLAGIGMGNHEMMTHAVSEAAAAADLLFGAPRMLEAFSATAEKKAYYRAEDIISCLHEKKSAAAGSVLRAAVLFSGDSGFYSGAGALFQALQSEFACGRLNGTVRILPGISSVSYLAAAIGESYEDAAVLSIHGRNVRNLVKKLAVHEKAFLLLNGAEDIRSLGERLLESGLDCEVTVGVRLSYPDQRLVSLTPKMCTEFKESGLITCFIRNRSAAKRAACHGLRDQEFIRDQVPMTKEEIREVSICKLQLKNTSVVYDIGSGTGSVAVETAGLSDEIQVYAVERKEEGVELIRANAKKHGLENITVIHGTAPEVLSELPTPTHAFIGGSGKQMEPILDVLYQKNPSMRIVINAVTLETAAELLQVLSKYPAAEKEIIQVQVNRAREVGSYHMMQAENPVWICSFSFTPKVRQEEL